MNPKSASPFKMKSLSLSGVAAAAAAVSASSPANAQFSYTVLTTSGFGQLSAGLDAASSGGIAINTIASLQSRLPDQILVDFVAAQSFSASFSKGITFSDSTYTVTFAGFTRLTVPGGSLTDQMAINATTQTRSFLSSGSNNFVYQAAQVGGTMDVTGSEGSYIGASQIAVTLSLDDQTTISQHGASGYRSMFDETNAPPTVYVEVQYIWNTGVPGPDSLAVFLPGAFAGFAALRRRRIRRD